jgi:hypothetical protein
MNSDYKKALDFVAKHKIKISVDKVERNHPHPYRENEVVDFYSIKVSRGTESFIKKWALGDLELDEGNYNFPALVYGVLSRIPLFLQPTFVEYALDSGAETEEEQRIAKIWYKDDIELHENAKRVLGDLFDELSEALYGESEPSLQPKEVHHILKKENEQAIMTAISNSTQMHNNFSALAKILAYEGQYDDRIELSKYIQRRDMAISKATKVKWYYEIITTFHAASAILHNGKYFYKCMVTDIDMDDLKHYLQERAKELLSDKVSSTSWAGKVRAATLKSLDLKELI